MRHSPLRTRTMRPPLDLLHDATFVALAILAVTSLCARAGAWRARLARSRPRAMPGLVAAPLALGALGAMLGLADTFQALDTPGIPETVALTRGVMTALAATALGTGVALVGLLARDDLDMHDPLQGDIR